MIEFYNVTFAWNAGGTPLFENLSLSIDSACATAILGVSGSGKSTLLRLIAGLEFPGVGSIAFEGQCIRGTHHQRTLVFQDYSLFDWMTVKQNIEIAMRWAGAGAHGPPMQQSELRNYIEETLASLGLAGFGNRMPRSLSGGMRQRAAIARALAVRPKLLLLDEPFSALDSETRKEARGVVARALSLSNSGVVLVTHQVEDAILMCDRAIVIGGSPTAVIADIALPFRAIDESKARDDAKFELLRSYLLATVKGGRKTP